MAESIGATPQNLKSLVSEGRTLKVAGLFAGIGGFERAFSETGFETALLCENDPAAQAVLRAHFPDVAFEDDVTDLTELPEGIDVVCAGFPCQNLSMAGDKTGIEGAKSGVIERLLYLLECSMPPVVVIENVYFMLHLAKGQAMKHLLGRLEGLKYKWAYRVLDTIGFGLPQRRRRVYLVATTDIDPRHVLLADDAGGHLAPAATLDKPLGFYWTEGRSGVGITADGIPPLKSGSAVGIASAPAVLFPDGFVGTPSIEVCEMLQGFPAGWTKAADDVNSRLRWRLVGNAVSVPVAEWVARRILEPGESVVGDASPLSDAPKWPNAAFNVGAGRYAVAISPRPLEAPVASIAEYRKYEWKPLSVRAASGFVRRAKESSLRFPAGFVDAIEGVLPKDDGRRVA